MLETSALGGHLTLSTRLSRFTPSLTQPPSLVKNFSPLNVDKEKSLFQASKLVTTRKREKQIFQINIKCLKIPTGGRQTRWPFTQRTRRVDLGATENKSSEWQGGGLEPGTTRFQVQRPSYLVIPPSSMSA